MLPYTGTIAALLALTSLMLASAACATAATPDELARARRWSTDNLGRAQALPAPVEPAATPKPSLLVRANHGDILQNSRPDGRLLRIGDAEFTHGLICHAVSEVVVRLPGPGRRFDAVVGVDANSGGGSIVFGVTVGDRKVFESAAMRGGAPGIPVSVDLAGQREFTLTAGDAGDGISSDHADWADATVALADGSTLRLGDMPAQYPAPDPRQATPPFSFRYGGVHSDGLLPGWDFAERTERLDARRSRVTQTYLDAATGLEARCVSVRYDDFPVVEWTVYLRNTGTSDTPIVEGLQGLDASFTRGRGSEFLLHHNVGSPCRTDDYAPLETPLPAGARQRISAAGGRPTPPDLCFFNIEWDQGGAIVGLGWPGQWAASFTRDEGTALRVVAGQERTHFTLHPGEEVRTPLVALLFWNEGDWIRTQNLWRQWMMAHSMPLVDGKPIPPHYGVCFGNLQPLAADEIAGLRTCVDERIPFSYYFLDAGWYPDQGAWWNTGTWEPDPERFPRRIREVSDLAHASGMKFVLWFEPERCNAGGWLSENHPEWVIGGKDGGLVNMGDPEAWKWVLETFDSLIVSEGVDVYRQDYNIDPLGYWQSMDTADRQGITENKYVVGYLAYWDELLRRHPGLYIDTCASGGRRNDLETLRRSVPLLRSDCFGGPTTQQAQTMGIAQWMPYYGSGQGPEDEYWVRSCYFPASRTGWDPATKPQLDVPLLRRSIRECADVQQYMTGDFYPLTPWSLDESVWAGWQWHMPASDEGAVQVFRRPECPTATMAFRLRGLDPEQRYVVKDADTTDPVELTGRELMEAGLTVTLPEPRSAAVIFYRRR